MPPVVGGGRLAMRVQSGARWGWQTGSLSGRSVGIGRGNALWAERGPTRRNPPAALTERRSGADESATLSQMRGSSADYWWPCPAAVLSVRPVRRRRDLQSDQHRLVARVRRGNQHANACMNGSGLMTAFNLLGIAVTCPHPAQGNCRYPQNSTTTACQRTSASHSDS